MTIKGAWIPTGIFNLCFGVLLFGLAHAGFLGERSLLMWWSGFSVGIGFLQLMVLAALHFRGEYP